MGHIPLSVHSRRWKPHTSNPTPLLSTVEAPTVLGEGPRTAQPPITGSRFSNLEILREGKLGHLLALRKKEGEIGTRNPPRNGEPPGEDLAESMPITEGKFCQQNANVSSHPTATSPSEWVVPQARKVFLLPENTDTLQWEKISERVREVILGLPNLVSGAGKLDLIHFSISETLSKMGFEKIEIPHGSRKICRRPLDKEIGTLRAEVRQSRKGAKTTGEWKKVWANIHVRNKVENCAAEIIKAKETRQHHKLSTENPKKLADKIWGRALGSDPPECSVHECESFFEEIFALPSHPETQPSWLPPQLSGLKIDPLVFTPKMISKALQKKATSYSAPGIDGLTYRTLAHFLPWLAAELAPLFNKLILEGNCPEIWRHGWTVLLHKGGEKKLANYRPITLTPTLAKLFHGMVAAWLEPAILKAGIISTAVQKGFLSGVAGAIEHDLVLDETLWQAKTEKRTMSMVLVDLKNAFGSVPHSRILWALSRYGVPAWVGIYVSSLYSKTFSKICCKNWSTKSLQVRRGVLQGDTLSPLLFLVVMQVGLHGLENSCPEGGFDAGHGGGKQFLKCFADDLTIIEGSPKKLQNTISKLESIMEWLGMEIKPSKCRVFGLSKGKYRALKIDIYGQTVLDVGEHTAKFLGMELTTGQTFKEKGKVVEKGVLDIMGKLDEFPLPKEDKVKLYKNFALPKMRWILMVQEVLPTALKKISGKVENLVKKWWHLPRSTSRDALRLVLGLPSLSDLAEQGQLVKHHIAQSSKDPKVKGVWAARNRRLHRPSKKLREVFGPDLPALRSEAKKTLSSIQHHDLQKTVEQLSVQGSWSKLGFGEEVEQKWKGVLWSLPSSVTQFASKAALDVLPTRANLLRWKMTCDGSCPRCGVKETLQHVLNHCDHLLLSGAYKWRHDSILQEMFGFFSSKKSTLTQILVDLPGHEYMLPFTPDSAWRPDLVLYDEGVNITFVELTVPFEENVSGANKRKTEKYQKLLENAKNAGFVPVLHCVEMGSRGLPDPSWTALAKKLPFGKSLTQRCSALAIRASFYIWAQCFAS